MEKIIFHKETKTFHLYNEEISYIMCVLENGHMGQLYYGKRIHDKPDFSYLVEKCGRPMTSYIFEGDRSFSLEHIRQEYPVYGTTDYRHPAIEIMQENGSNISEFKYVGYEILKGKPSLKGLPATYTESEEEAETLKIILKDSLTGAKLTLLYTIFSKGSAIARSAHICNEGEKVLHLQTMMSLNLDLPDKDYVWMQLSGAWSRERYVKNRILEQGITAIDSMRGNSSHEHNPFMVLKRPNAGETSGEVIGFSLIYSGNFRMQAEVDTHDVTRITVGINPDRFDWKLEPGEEFQTPEAVMVYSDQGLNKMSQTFHRLYAKRLARGYWRDRPRPILNNNWEATYFNFTEDRLVQIASKAKECGVELFVLDDGWFGQRNDDHAGLGDWVANPERLPNGIKGLSERIEAMGIKFGLWFEPEMVNKDSDLYRAHPDWAFAIPGRVPNHSRNQLVLDMTREDVREYLLERLTTIVHDAKIDYVKWDMNRSVCDVYSHVAAQNRNGELYHRYVLGVYDLLERFLAACPDLLLEGCSGGGGRYDAGMMYYSPQIWCSDNTDAINRLSIQYGSSFFYPISTVGSHVSVCPNHQTGRVTPFRTRGDVALAGSFGYEMDLNKISEEEKEMVKEQVAAMHEYYELTHEGLYYRLTGLKKQDFMAWEFVAKDQSRALLTIVKTDAEGNMLPVHTKVCGLAEDKLYRCSLDQEVRLGRTWNRAGLTLHQVLGEYESIRVEFTEVK